MRYHVESIHKGSIAIEAPDETEARRLAMVEWYGEKPDAVVPYAPDYRGSGLTVWREPASAE